MNRALALCLILIGLSIAKPALANDTVYYYYNDAQGSPVAVTDASGNVIERTQYAPYGEVLNRAEHDGPGYTKHEEDAATGLTNMQQRYDDKVVGRMLSMDPMDVDPTTGANFNRYAYANDNPYRFTDPDGRCAPEMCHWGSEGGIGVPDPCQLHPCLATGGQAKQSSRPAGQCDETCDPYRQTNADIVQEQHAAVHAASKEFAKQAGWMAVNVIGGRVLGKVLGGISKFFGFASEDAGVAFRADTSHIFRDAPGHLAEDTAENRALLRGAVKPDNLMGTRGPGGSIGVYRETLSDGRQVWVEVRDGSEITNGGVNDVPRQ